MKMLLIAVGALLLAALAVPVLAITAAASVLNTAGAVVVGVAVGAGADVNVGTVTACSSAGMQVAGQSLDSGQVQDAEIIYQVGVKLGLPSYGEQIAIATAMQESSLVNLTDATNYDSLGLFQQRPSQGWGTPAELTDPVYASTKFYQALEEVSGWQSLPLTDAAQRVQRSAYPDAYAHWTVFAADLVTTFSSTGGACPSTAT